MFFIASLNGVSRGGWIGYAKKLEEALVDAHELNITYIPTDIELSSQDIEEIYLDALKAVKESVKIPVSIKMNAIFSAPANMAKRFYDAGADGVVLFDRAVAVDIDLENLTALHSMQKTTSHDMSEGLRWSAILYNKIDSSLCLSTGVQNHKDILKAIMSGADTVAMVGAVMERGPKHIKKSLKKLKKWMRKKEYTSIEQMKGSISLAHTNNPAAYERANYMRVLTDYRF